MDWQGAWMARAKAAYAKTYWVNAPQNTVLPYATMIDVTELLSEHLTGDDLAFARVQIDVWGKSYSEVQTGMAALLAALRPANTGNGHTFQRATVALGPRDIGGEREGDTIIYRKSADLIVPHN